MMNTPQQLREAILAADLGTSNFGETPKPENLYLPRAHSKALRLDAHVVVGGRGVGKSFWTAALQSNDLRARLGQSESELQALDVRTGFSNAEKIDRFPNADVFSKFLAQNGDPYDLWRAVVLRWVAEKNGQNIPRNDWPSTVSWLRNEPEQAARMMQQERNWRGLILFDALDRTSNDWQHMDLIVRGLLRTVLWLKGFGGLYAKVFLREDQAERTVFNFPDASKLKATKADLTWARNDLHGLLWQRFINAPDVQGERLRKLCAHTLLKGAWSVGPDMKFESEQQRSAFESIAGPWMGRDKRRGVPYTWAVGHLADGRGQTSPRSFLAAIKQAAEDSSERYPQHDFALHYESIKRGIQKASEIRVQEIAEDYPWVPNILSVLKGTNVPADYQTVKKTWKGNLPADLNTATPDRLPAQHADRGWDGLRDDLQHLGLIEMKKDGRLDMPDLYRVGFGLGRRGGVKPRN